MIRVIFLQNFLQLIEAFELGRKMPKNSQVTNSTSQVSFFGRLWQGFLTTVGTERFFQIFSPWVKYLAAIAAILLGVGTVWGLGFAPPDYLQGNSYRIIFIPCANGEPCDEYLFCDECAWGDFFGMEN